MTNCGCNKADCCSVRDYMMEMLDGAEKWMWRWLVFDEERMKQLGMRKLDVTLECCLSWVFEVGYFDEEYGWEEGDRDRLQSILENNSAEWIEQRIKSLSNIDQRCNIQTKTVGGCLLYIVTFCLFA